MPKSHYEAPSPPKQVMGHPEKEDPLAKYEDFMKNLKKQFQVEQSSDPRNALDVDKMAKDDVQKPKEFDYLDFSENEKRLQQLTRPGNLDRFKNLLGDESRADIFPR